MKIKLAYLVLLLIFSFCKKDHHVTISGIVLDEVTRQSVVSARVAMKIYACYDQQCHSQELNITPVMTDNNGKYILNYTYEENESFSFPAEPMVSYKFPSAYNIYASKSEYIGSDTHNLSDGIYTNADILLFHSGDLNIRVKNENLYKQSAVKLCLDKGYGFTTFGIPEFTFNLYGTNLDTLLRLKKLWANKPYAYIIIKPEQRSSNPFPLLSSSVVVRPDTVTDLLIVF